MTIDLCCAFMSQDTRVHIKMTTPVHPLSGEFKRSRSMAQRFRVTVVLCSPSRFTSYALREGLGDLGLPV
jgi:hypothetical protein